MKKNLNQKQSHANYGKSAMETGDHFKNGANPKSRMSIQKLLVLFFTMALCLLSCNKDDVNVTTDLSEEEITTFYTSLESFVETPDFRSCSSIEELKPLMENWLKQQSEIENVKIDGNILTFTLVDGSITEIEFTESEELVLEEPLDFEQETVNGSYFTDFNASDVIFQEQAVTKSLSRAINDNSPGYIFPVFWEPDATLSSIVPSITKLIEKSKFHKYTHLTNRGTQCDPLELRKLLDTVSQDGLHKPNLIIINAHGSPIDWNGNAAAFLQIGSYSKYVAYSDIVQKLKNDGGLDFSNERTRIKMDSDHFRYMVSLSEGNLRQLLKGVDISNSIVFLNVCYGTIFADIFLDLGAAYVYGYDSEARVDYAYNITNELLHYLIVSTWWDQLKEIFGFGATLKTTGYALNAVKSPTLSREPIWKWQTTYLYGMGEPDFKFQHPVSIAPSRNSAGTLRTKASLEPAVAMYGCHINYYSPGADYSGNYCGLVFSSETDNPKFDDGKSYCVFTRLNHEVFGGEDFYFSINDIKHNTQYYYRAFVCSVYGDQAHIYYSEEVEPFVVEGEKEEEPDKDWVEINGVKWAPRNVGAPSTFVENPADYGGYYSWYEAHNVCPAGWRLPTNYEVQLLITASQSNNILEKIFFPTAGSFYNDNFFNEYGDYWINQIDYGNNNKEWYEFFSTKQGKVYTMGDVCYEDGYYKMSVRCVKGQ
jgi:uncharacterized protein (TIGR02145 family)